MRIIAAGGVVVLAYGPVICTGYECDQYVFALLEAGAAGYLLKDVRG